MTESCACGPTHSYNIMNLWLNMYSLQSGPVLYLGLCSLNIHEQDPASLVTGSDVLSKCSPMVVGPWLERLGPSHEQPQLIIYCNKDKGYKSGTTLPSASMHFGKCWMLRKQTPLGHPKTHRRRERVQPSLSLSLYYREDEAVLSLFSNESR